MIAQPNYRPSRGDRVGIVIFMIAGAGLVIGSGISAVLRIWQVLRGDEVAVRVQPINLTVQAPLGPEGAPVPLQVDTGTVLTSPLPEAAVGVEILGQIIRFGTIATITICLLLLAQHVFQGRVFSRRNTRLATAAGIVGITGFAVATALTGTVGGTALFELGAGSSEGFVFMVADPTLYILGGFALAVVLTAFTIGSRLQRDAEGLV